MPLSEEQERILRHMLGVDDRRVRDPKPYRNYYCANPGDAELHALQSLGMVRLSDTRGGYEWFATTDAGRAAALASQRRIRYPKARRRYIAWLSVRDAFADVTFRDFLTRPEFAETRRRA